MLFINCKVNLFLTWPSTCVITNPTGAGTFEITGRKLYVPVVTLSTQDNSKLLQQLKSGFKRTVNWNKYLSKPELLARNTILKNLVELIHFLFKHFKMMHKEHCNLAIIFQM